MRLEGASPVGNLPHWGVHISFQVGVGVSVSSKCNKRSWVFSSPQQKLAQSAANCNSFLQMQAALLIQHTPGHNDGGLYQPGSHGPAAFQQRTHAQRFVASYYVHNMCTVYCIYIYMCVCVQHILPTNFQFSSGSYSFQSHVTHGTPAEVQPSAPEALCIGLQHLLQDMRRL